MFEYVYNELENGNNYFRLKFVTADGKTEYSSTLVTKKKCDTHTVVIKVIPNPVVNADIIVRCYSPVNTTMDFAIVSSLGTENN